MALENSYTVEFDDSLVEMESWTRPRYKGCRLKGAKINEYTEGDITYGLKPVISNQSTAIYFGTTIIGAEIEDDTLCKIKGHSYIEISKVYLIDYKTDHVTILDTKNEPYDSISKYISNDFKPGNGFNIELIDEGVSNKLKTKYFSKFSRGKLIKTVEYTGHQGTSISSDNTSIGAGYIDGGSGTSFYAPFDLLSSSLANFNGRQHVFSYGREGFPAQPANDTDYSSTNLSIKDNDLTKAIWPSSAIFGRVNYTTNGSLATQHIEQFNVFINSLLIPTAKSGSYDLFVTFNNGESTIRYGQTKDWSSIFSGELDLDRYNSTALDGDITSVVSSSYANLGEESGKTLNLNSFYLIPFKQGPYDIRTDLTGSINSTNTINNTVVGGVGNNYSMEMYVFDEDKNTGPAIYQISYLQKDTTIIADIDKTVELTNDVGDDGFIIIPENLNRNIKNNLDFYLDQIGLKENPNAEKLPPYGE